MHTKKVRDQKRQNRKVIINNKNSSRGYLVKKLNHSVHMALLFLFAAIISLVMAVISMRLIC